MCLPLVLLGLLEASALVEILTSMAEEAWGGVVVLQAYLGMAVMGVVLAIRGGIRQGVLVEAEISQFQQEMVSLGKAVDQR